MSIIAYASFESRVCFYEGGVPESSLGYSGSKWVYDIQSKLRRTGKTTLTGSPSEVVRKAALVLASEYMKFFSPSDSEHWIYVDDMVVGDELIIADGLGKTVLRKLNNDHYLIIRRTVSGKESVLFDGDYRELAGSLFSGKLSDFILTDREHKRMLTRLAVDVLIEELRELLDSPIVSGY